MKRQLITRTIYSGLIITVISLIFSSCVLTNKIIEENDIVYSTKRIELKYLCKDYNRKSPLLYLEQSIIKEIEANKESSIKVFDILALTGSSFKLEYKVFLIVDNDVYPMVVDNKEYELSKTITANE